MPKTHDPSHNRKQFFKILGVLGFLLWLLFLGTMSYLYGSIYKFPSRIHAFRVLHVDFDNGIIGESLAGAYNQLQGPSFPTLVEKPAVDYPDLESVVSKVRSADYWGAFVVHSNSSDRLSMALKGGEAAETYNSTPALTYVWNEVRYPPISDEALGSSFETLIEATRLAFNAKFAPKAMASMNSSDPAALQVLLNPITSASINITPTPQGTKLFYNTVGMVMPILQQFFFLLMLNGVSFELKIYKSFSYTAVLLIRTAFSVVFTFGAGLCQAGYIWAFRESWDVNGGQFVLTWMTLWLLMYIHLLVLDTGTAFLPPPALPFLVLTYIILNITGTISPFEVNPGFYRWAYALPGRNAYDVLTDIWSGGAVPRLYRALPILFAWLLVAQGLATFGHHFRFHRIMKLYEKDEKSDNEASDDKEGLPEYPSDLNLHRRVSEEMTSEV
ncbi:LADA_0F15522g1_1 [Lachancea dasiensis]|uniref:LADA_0F15522g1_1 n=1 Tax=Lachancea dasiensis TaxID=1072105 RepID=A0A1G4JNK6_9SACH|nr:LADA_0F15522g1_1 [Lachancea dasiensis]